MSRRMQADDTNRLAACIFDIDGVLLDIRHLLDAHIFNRNPGDIADWPSFNAGLATCTPIPTYIGLCNALWHGGLHIELVTSRSESLREVTEASLSRAGVCYDRMWMRPLGMEHVGSKLLEFTALAEKYDVVAAFEDDPVNVMALRHLHIPTVPVDSGYHNHPWVDGAESAD